MTDTARQWPVKDARASFSELVDRALDDGPQIVTRNGKPTVVVVSIEEWDRRSRRKGDLSTSSPDRPYAKRVSRSRA